jgi:hypothetical protein
MSLRPDGTRPLDTTDERAQTKLAIAATAVKTAIAAPADGTVRFGLELFPRVPSPDQGACVTLSARLEGTAPTNPACDPGEISVPPALANSGSIAAALDPEAMLLCDSSPLGEALGVALPALDPQRKRYAVLITGGDTTCSADAVAKASDLKVAGVPTFVIAIGTKGDPDAGLVDNRLMNEVACAGGTARSFDQACVQDEAGTGYSPRQPTGAHLYASVVTVSDLVQAIGAIVGSVCCGCGADGGPAEAGGD